MSDTDLKNLDTIVRLLGKNYQRATYGAVAEFTGLNQRTLMGDRPKEPKNSWIVAEKDGRPTRYTPEQTDPALVVRMDILRTGAALEEWLATARQ
jgi:hypothetical protein